MCPGGPGIFGIGEFTEDVSHDRLVVNIQVLYVMFSGRCLPSTNSDSPPASRARWSAGMTSEYQPLRFECVSNDVRTKAGVFGDRQCWIRIVVECAMAATPWIICRRLRRCMPEALSNHEQIAANRDTHAAGSAE